MANHDRNRKLERGLFGRLTGKAVGWGAVIAVALIIGVPTALLFGAGDFIFDSPRDGIVTFFATLVLVAAIFLLEAGWGYLKERRRGTRD